MKVETIACNWCGRGLNSGADLSPERGQADKDQQGDICIECLTGLAEDAGLTSNDDGRMIQFSSKDRITPRGQHKPGTWESYLEKIGVDCLLRYYPVDEDIPLEIMARRASGAISTYHKHHPTGRDFRSIKGAKSVFIIRIK